VVAATEEERTRLYVVPVDGGSPVRLVDGPSYNPIWSPDGQFIVYSEPVRGSELAVKAIKLDKSSVPLPPVTVRYTIATPYRFAPDRKSLIVNDNARDNFRSRNFYMIDIETGRQRQLTDLKGYMINSFDVSPDGKQIVFDRLRDDADIVLFELER
jgi:Tol biopolymer transport system component